MRKHLVRVVPDEKIIKYLDEINHEISTILENIDTLDIAEHLKISNIIDTNITSNQIYTNIINKLKLFYI